VTVGTIVVGYVRVSTEEQGASGLGLEAQKRAIRAECRRRGWQLDRIEEDVLSGRSMKRRSGLAAALKSCRSGDAAGIVVAKLDRLSRSLVDFASVLVDAQKRGYNVVAIDLGVDLSTPQGEFLANVMASAAQWERRIIGQRTRDALAEKREREPDWKPGRPVTLDVNVRRRIKQMRGRGMSLSAIAAKLNADEVPTAHDGKQWYASTVRSVIGDA
jgi:DNA invertase Pin-like site-specific DNA recombinase